MPQTMPTISFTVNDKKQQISSRTLRSITSIVAQQRALKYWKKRHPVYDPSIDLAVLKHATTNTATWNKRWLSKWQSGICGVGIHLKRWRDQDHSKCPRCQTEGETVHHVLTCPHENASYLWHTGIVDIESWMRRNNCIKGFDTAVGQRLREWRNQQPFQPIVSTDSRVHQLIQAMDQVGWRHFGFGIVPKLWTQYQSSHLKALGSK